VRPKRVRLLLPPSKVTFSARRTKAVKRLPHPDDAGERLSRSRRAQQLRQTPNRILPEYLPIFLRLRILTRLMIGRRKTTRLLPMRLRRPARQTFIPRHRLRVHLPRCSAAQRSVRPNLRLNHRENVNLRPNSSRRSRRLASSARQRWEMTRLTTAHLLCVRQHRLLVHQRHLLVNRR